MKKVFEVMSVFSQGLGVVVFKGELELLKHVFEIINGSIVKAVEHSQNFTVCWMTSCWVHFLTKDEKSCSYCSFVTN